MLEPPPTSEYSPYNSLHSKPLQPDLSSYNNLENTPENQSETEDMIYMELIAKKYMIDTNSSGSHSSSEGGSKNSSTDQSKPEEEKPTAPEKMLFAMPDNEWYINHQGRSYLSEFIKNTQEKKVDVKSPEELEEELKKLELSEKKKKVDELKKELNTIKTQTPRLFEELKNEVEKLITQIEKETNTVTALTKHRTTISEIIAKIEDPEIYRSFEENRITHPEIYKSFLKDPIRATITKILADDPKDEPKIDEEFKKLFEADPDSITKIITPIVKENAIQKIITEIKQNASQDPQTEDDEFDSFGKIIEKILAENSLITKYYKRDPYSIAGIIDQLQSKKTDEKIDEDPITKITDRILSENAKAFKAIAEDPLGQIIIEHKKETSEKILSAINKANLTIESVKNSENIPTEVAVKKADPPTEKFKIFGQEVKEGKVVHATILNLEPYKLAQIQKPSFISGLFSSQTTLKQNRYIALSYDLKDKADFVFVQLEENTNLSTEVENLAPSTEVKKPAPPTEEKIRESVIKKQNIKFRNKIKEFAEKQAEEELHEKDEKGRSFDVKRLLIYAKLIDKIPQEYSDSISSIHQEIISLKKQEKDHKKTLVFLTPIIIREEAEEKERKRIAEEENQIGIFERELTAVEEKLKVVQVKIEENEEEKKLALEEEKRRQSALPSRVKLSEDIRKLGEEINQIQEKLDENSKTRRSLEENIKEILSPEYVDEKLAHGPKESIMDQLIVEAIIVDEAKKLLRPDEIQEIETEILQQSSDNIPSEAFNLLVLKKALEIKFQHEGLQIQLLEYSDKIFTQQNIDNFFSFKNELSKYRDEIQTLEVESKAIKDQIYELEIALTGKELALPQGLALQESDQASWVSAQQISASLHAEHQKQQANPEESGQDKTGLPIEKWDQDYPLPNLGIQSSRSFGTGLIFEQTLEPENQSYQQETTIKEVSIATLNSDQIFGGIQTQIGAPYSDQIGGVEDQNNLQQSQDRESSTAEYTSLSSTTYDPYSVVLSTAYPPPLALPPPPSIEEQDSLAPLTTEGAVILLKKMLEESSREEPEDTREVVRYDSWQSSGSFNGDQSNFNHLNQDHLLADQSLQREAPEDQEDSTLPFSEHSFFQGYASDEQFIKNTEQVFATASLFNQESEDNKKKEIEEKKIKKSFSNLFLRCLLEKMESPVKENSDQNSQIQNLQTESNASSEEETLSAKSFVQEEITLNPKEIFECKEKISDHLASEYQKLLEKLESPKPKIFGLQDDGGNDDNQSDQSSQDIVKTQEPIEDPKIYCGVGIRMALEKETIDGTEQHYLKIVDIFEDSALSDDHKNQKISAVGIKENGEIKFKSITDILADCGGDNNKFYAKISTIFHNPSEEKISLKFKMDSSTNQDENQISLDGTFAKKLFCPDKSESLKIADIKYFTSNLNSNRQISDTLLGSASQTIRQ